VFDGVVTGKSVGTKLGLQTMLSACNLPTNVDYRTRTPLLGLEVGVWSCGYARSNLLRGRWQPYCATLLGTSAG